MVVQFYFHLLNAKPSKHLEVDYDTGARGMLAYYLTHLNAFMRDTRNTKEMRDAQHEACAGRTFEQGEFKGFFREI